jgi:hypothetical protein
MKAVFVAALALATLSAAPATQTFTGTITDDMCALAGHASMRMGPTDADCVRACVSAHGASYVLLDGKNVYGLSDQTLPAQWAGQKVKVVGTLDAGTKVLQVQSMSAAR